jgi:hypothetical protein
VVGANGFEPSTSWSRRLVARKINKLHGTRRVVTKCNADLGLGAELSSR